MMGRDERARLAGEHALRLTADPARQALLEDRLRWTRRDPEHAGLLAGWSPWDSGFASSS
ncbi:hypothetical protein [Nonomuraea sp. NPDC048916]|uniref:hypothetical protein n=1 Tax=Nonomuraea sp. NPDC048916 TaxID=3154232 RepID=UPI00340F666D